MFEFIAKHRDLVLALTLLFLAVSLFGIFGMMSAHQHEGMAPTHCLFMGETAVCSMTPLDHLARWQTMMSASVIEMLVLALLALVVVHLLGFLQHSFKPPNITRRRGARYRAAGLANIFSHLLGSAISPRAP